MICSYEVTKSRRESRYFEAVIVASLLFIYALFYFAVVVLLYSHAFLRFCDELDHGTGCVSYYASIIGKVP